MSKGLINMWKWYTAWLVVQAEERRWGQYFFGSFVWKILYLSFITVDSFIAIPQLYRVIVTDHISGLSLATFSTASAFGVFLILYGIEQKKPEMPIAGIIGFGLNFSIVAIALSKGVRTF